jgi:hypothetical protein
MAKQKQTAPIEIGKPKYSPVPMDLGFIVLGHDGDPSKVSTTLKSIERSYPGAKTVTVIPAEFKKDHKSALIGGTSITSLINIGMKNPPAEWNAIVFAGVHIKEKLDQRYSSFMESRLDIFFPLIWGAWNFIDAPINGLTIHRDTFQEVGTFGVDNSLEICKMMWFLNADDKGCKFKAVAGCRMC